MQKECKDCGNIKPLTQFYKGAGMSDGFINSCKECKKEYTKKNYKERFEFYQEYEKLRFRDKDRKKHVVGYQRAHRKKYPEKYRAREAIATAIDSKRINKQPCERCGQTNGIEAHHEDYLKPLDVTWLCRKHHRERHKEINESLKVGAQKRP